MQCACAILSSVAYPTVQYFSTLSHKRPDVRESVIEHKTHVLIFSTNLSETFLITRRTERDMIKIYIGRHVQYPLFLLRFNETLIFSKNFQKKKKYSNIKFHENPSSGNSVVPCRQTDGQTSRHDEAHSSFSQFCEPA
jgi:hypothetical protein